MSTPANLDPFAILAGTGGAVPVGNAAKPAPGYADPAPPMGEAQLAADLPEVLSGTNPLAVAANPLLNLKPDTPPVVHKVVVCKPSMPRKHSSMEYIS